MAMLDERSNGNFDEKKNPMPNNKLKFSLSSWEGNYTL
jgi:hypothetical protein